MVGVRTLVLALGLASACTRNPNVTVNTHVGVSIDPAPRELPFDPRGARLASAYRQLEQIAGHPVELTLDAAITPASRASFEDALVEAFESVARDLDKLRQADKSGFEFGVARLYRVEVRYDGTLREDAVHLDEPSRTLVIRGAAARTALVPPGTTYYYLMSAYADDETRRFAPFSPDQIAPEQRYEYFLWLTSADWIRRERSRKVREKPPPYAEAATTLNVLRLWKLNSGRDPLLAEKTRSWLIAEGSNFVRQYVQNLKNVMALPADSVFNQAAGAWAAWIISIYPTLEDDTRVRVAQDLFFRCFNRDRALTKRDYPAFAWPGADLFALGLSEIDRWRASGHPNQLTKPRISPALDFFVCAHTYSPKERASYGAQCKEDWYDYTLETQRGRQRLASAMTARNDPAFTEIVFKNIGHSGNQRLDTMIVMLRDLESDAKNWEIGWRTVINDFLENNFSLGILEETRRLWVTYPERRGILLSALARMDNRKEGNVDWKGFSSAFGNPISAGEFADYLAIDAAALSYASLVWPALGRGWSRAALVVPRISAWEVSERQRGYGHQYTFDALYRVIGEMCREKNSEDLSQMRVFLKQSKDFANLVEYTHERGCEPPPAPPPPRNEVKLSPLKLGLPPLRIIQTGAE